MTITEFFLHHKCPKDEQMLLISYLAFLRMKATLAMLPK